MSSSGEYLRQSSFLGVGCCGTIKRKNNNKPNDIMREFYCTAMTGRMTSCVSFIVQP